MFHWCASSRKDMVSWWVRFSMISVVAFWYAPMYWRDPGLSPTFSMIFLWMSSFILNQTTLRRFQFWPRPSDLIVSPSSSSTGSCFLYHFLMALSPKKQIPINAYFKREEGHLTSLSFLLSVNGLSERLVLRSMISLMMLASTDSHWGFIFLPEVTWNLPWYFTKMSLKFLSRPSCKVFIHSQCGNGLYKNYIILFLCLHKINSLLINIVYIKLPQIQLGLVYLTGDKISSNRWVYHNLLHF